MASLQATIQAQIAIPFCMLDGEEHFLHASGLITFLADNIRIPETLIVAIVNTDRTRDLSPRTQVEEVGDSVFGGANRFRSFMTRELAPWVEQNYRTTPQRILVGHSLGGLFAIHALINEPTAFESYIAISPALGWDDQRLVAEAEAFFDATPQLNADLFTTVGNEGGSLLGGIRKLSGVLDEKAPRDFRPDVTSWKANRISWFRIEASTWTWRSSTPARERHPGPDRVLF